ncbi:hypothetical protein [Sphingomonas humi]|uniref:hypothetical protein n=1 Tax=Sphingomonas humi TaxID=335630 RepID=UPI0031D6B303
MQPHSDARLKPSEPQKRGSSLLKLQSCSRPSTSLKVETKEALNECLIVNAESRVLEVQHGREAEATATHERTSVIRTSEPQSASPLSTKKQLAMIDGAKV